KNQNSNNDFLLRLLLIVGSVISGYGYLLLRFDVEKYDEKLVFVLMVIAEILLLIYFKIIFDEGFAFRRDQIVAFRILRKYELIAESIEDEKNHDKVFTYHYNPLKKFEIKNGKLKPRKGLIVFWMPAFHNTLSSSIFILHLLLYFSFIIKVSNANFRLVIFALLLITSVISLQIVIRKHSWLKALYFNEIHSMKE
ncbi:MAG: hypothetical protein IT219_04435, partial [Bacteroidales bacterium]|nr:hypothetical protein [Bacteroidales bacterium]